jgi:aspartyl/asparaginyl-tRNA synthetase
VRYWLTCIQDFPRHSFEIVCAHLAHVFRAENHAQQQAWLSALETQTALATDNDYIMVAEHIVCDEEYARCVQRNQAALKLFEAQQAQKLPRPP